MQFLIKHESNFNFNVFNSLIQITQKPINPKNKSNAHINNQSNFHTTGYEAHRQTLQALFGASRAILMYPFSPHVNPHEFFISHDV